MDTRRINYEEDTFLNDVKQYGRLNNTLLGFHIVFLIVSAILRVLSIFTVNIFSILFYLLVFPLLKGSKKKIKIYLFLMTFEITLYIFLSALIIGWDSGFQLWLFALLGAFLFPYMTPVRTKARTIVESIVLVAFVFLLYVGVYWVTHNIELPFALDTTEEQAKIFHFINVVLALSAIFSNAYTYTRQMEYKYSRLTNMADFDQLTGLGNRYYMNDVLDKYADDQSNLGYYSVAMLDIDFFKKINDTYGHENGDIVLQEIAYILTKKESKNIKVGRWGGEEFLIVSDCTVGYNDFKDMIETIRKDISETVFKFSNRKVRCTVSIGASHSYKGICVKEVLKKADENLYIAKETGRNRIVA